MTNQNPSFVEIAVSLKFQATLSKVNWTANGKDEPYHELIFSVSRFTSINFGEFEPREVVSGFVEYEENRLNNLPLSKLRVVNFEKFENEQKVIAGIKGQPYIQLQKLDGELGCAEIGYWGDNSVDCFVGISQSIFQKILEESRLGYPISIHIYCLCKVKVASVVQHEILRAVLLQPDIPISLHITYFRLEQQIDH